MQKLIERLLELANSCDKNGNLPSGYHAEMLDLTMQTLQEQQKITERIKETSLKIDNLNQNFDVRMTELKNMIDLFTMFIATKDLEEDFSKFVEDLATTIDKQDQIN